MLRIIKSARRRAPALAILGGAITALALTAPDVRAKSIAELYEAAKEDGAITILGPPIQSFREELRNAFSTRFPDIDFEFSGMRTYQINAKLKAETKAGVHAIDVIISGPSTGRGYRGDFKPLLVNPEALEQSKWRDGAFAWTDENKTALGLVWQTSSVAVINTDLVKPGEIKSDADLLDPKWKGKMTSGLPVIPGAAKLTFRRLYDVHGPEFVQKLLAQDIVFTKDYRQGMDWVAKGQYAIGLAPGASVVAHFLQRGVKNIKLVSSLDWKEPLHVTPGFGTLIIPKKVAHPAATQLMLNWLLTKEGQFATSKGLGLSAMRVDVPEEHTLPATRKYEGEAYIPAYTDAFYGHPNEKKMIGWLKSKGVR